MSNEHKDEPNETPVDGDSAKNDAREAKAQDIIQHATKWAAGAGLIPIPMVDLISALGLQIAMVRDLAQLYEVDFDAQRAKTLIGTLAGSIGAATIGKTFALSLLRSVVPPLAILAGPSSVAAFTWVVGVAFKRHFQRGGQLHTFDTATINVGTELKRAKVAVAEVLLGAGNKTPAAAGSAVSSQPKPKPAG